jgi:hypothetical protein
MRKVFMGNVIGIHRLSLGVLCGLVLLSSTVAEARPEKITVQGVLRRTGETGTNALITNTDANGGLGAQVTLSLIRCTAGAAVGSACTTSGALGSYNLGNGAISVPEAVAGNVYVKVRNGAFAISFIPSSSTKEDLISFRNNDWYVSLTGALDPYSTASTEFLIPLQTVPFALSADIADTANRIKGITVDVTSVAANKVLKYSTADGGKLVFADDDVGAGGGGGGTYTAGTGIQLTGASSNVITVDSSVVPIMTAGKIGVSNLPTGTAANQLPVIQTGGKLDPSIIPQISSTGIANNAINTAHIADGQVTDAKIASGIDASKLAGAASGLSSVTTTGNVTAGGNVAASGNVSGTNVSASALLSGATIQSSSLTASKFLQTDASKNLVSSTANVTDTEFAYLSGATANLQTQINSISGGAGSYVAKAGDTMTGTLRGTTLLLNDGAVTAPSFSFHNATGAGLWHAGGSLNFSAGGVRRLEITSAGDVRTYDGSSGWASIYAGRVLATQGTTAASPAFTFNDGIEGNGLYFPTAGAVGLASGSQARLTISSAGIINVPGLTASRFLFSDASSNLTASTATVTQTEFAYLTGATANLQTQINSLGGGGGSITDRVAKAGDTMTGTLVMPGSGTAAATSLNFGTAGTGLYGNATNVNVGIAGSNVLNIYSNGGLGVNVYGWIEGMSTATFPSLNIKENGTVRLYEATANGTNYVQLRSPSNIASDITYTLPSTGITNGYALKTDASGNLYWDADAGASGGITGPTSSVANSLPRFNGTAGTTLKGTNVVVDDSDNVTGAHDLTATGTLTGGTLAVAVGSVSAPAITFTGSTGTGIYGNTNGGVYFSVNNTNQAQASGSGFGVKNGSATNPSLNFFNDNGTGFYSVSSGILGIAAGGSQRMTVGTGGVNISSLTGDRFLFGDSAKNVTSTTAAVTQTEFAYLTGATANLQTQINTLSTGGVAADSITFDKLKATASSEAAEPNRITASYTYGNKQSDGTTNVTYTNASAVTLSVISRLPISIAHVDCGVGDAVTAGERLVFCGEF